jgi:hypothetical protein
MDRQVYKQTDRRMNMHVERQVIRRQEEMQMHGHLGQEGSLSDRQADRYDVLLIRRLQANLKLLWIDS